MTDVALISALARPEAYPWHPSAVEVIETHISWVFLAGNRVVKVKRPVRFGFVDHSTVELRRHSCEEEVRLNRRLTDGVYLGVVLITSDGGHLAIDGDGDPVEWATLMRRLPADGMLDHLLASGTVPPDLAARLARRLIPFHRDLATDCGCQEYGTARALAAVLTDNLDELRSFAGTRLAPRQLALVDEAIHSFLAGNADLLAGRVAGGWVRDGHGDLRPEHVCLERDDETQIFDCVEFNPAIRCADVASDLAFLLMELDRLGVDDIGGALEECYRDAGIPLPPSLLRLYRAHRALVRAKVDCLTLSTEHQEHPGLSGEARTYLNLATRAALTVRPFLVVMSGLSGTGKSTIARALAEATGAVLHSSDTVRKELAHPAGDTATDWGEGIYTKEWTDRTYRRLHEQAAADLAVGHPVILDATYLETKRRLDAVQLGSRAGVPVLLVETVCDEHTGTSRLAARAARHDSPSDATLDTYRRQREVLAAAPPAVPAEAISVILDTADRTPGLLDPVFTVLTASGAIVPRVP
jgi:aminoglycoside phosphotransferase family enzyme/predicted kinase